MITSQVDPERQLVIHQVEGDLTLAGILLAMQSVQEHAGFQPDFAVLWDLRGNTLHISMQEIIHLHPAIVAMANKLRPQGKVAWVPATRFGETVINTLYNEHPWSQEWRTFSSVEEALNWAEADRT